MAEAFAKSRFGDGVHVASAGLRPQGASDAENAIYTLREHFRIDASHHVPRDVRSLNIDAFSVVVAMDATVGRQLSRITDRMDIRVWRVDDPYGDDLDEYRRCAHEILRLVVALDIPGT